MRALIIDRETWCRGSMGPCGDGDSRLLRSDGLKCCLGFECLSRGLPEELILGAFYPSTVRVAIALGVESWMLRRDQHWRSDGKIADRFESLAVFNDAAGVDDPTREAWLTEGFRVLADTRLVFVDTRAEAEKLRKELAA